MQRSTWEDLVIERQATPRRLSNEDFGAWMEDTPIFVSSVMDDEMNPARAVARETITRLGGNPLMWETLAPGDIRPNEAYLTGVEQSRVVLLLLGHRYGTSNADGFSPTHQEGNHAKMLHIPRLMFQPERIDPQKRYGNMTQWVGGLYNEIAGAKYSDESDLATQIESKLREMAAQQLNYWIKLDNVVFPGEVKARTAAGATTYTITTSARTPMVKQRFEELAHNPPRSTTLTWGERTTSIGELQIDISTVTRMEDQIQIVAAGHSGHTPSFTGVTIQTGMLSITPDMQAENWARVAFLGEESSLTADRFTQLLIPSAENDRLSQLLQRFGARGWFAEGLTNLFVVEKLNSNFGAVVRHLEAGPATATGLRLEVQFNLNGYNPRLITVAGIVPFTNPR